MPNEIEKTADVLEDEKWDAKLKRERIEDEDRVIAKTLELNRTLDVERHNLDIEKNRLNNQHFIDFNDARDVRVTWIEVVANSSLPVVEACARADEIVAEYEKRFRP